MKKIIKKAFVSCAVVASAFALAGCDNSYKVTPHVEYAGYEVDLNNDGVISESEKNLTWAESYDELIKKVKTSGDQETRYAYMHMAETLLMSTGAIVPLYNYTDIYMLKPEVQGFYSSPLGFKYFMGATYGDLKDYKVNVGPNPDSIDPAVNSAVDGATLIIHAFSGLMKNAVVEGEIGVAKDVASSVTSTTLADGKVQYVFTLRDNLKWSDGTSYDANDFVYSWNRAAGAKLGADYGYMFDVIDNYDKVCEDETGVEKLNVTASADGKTLTVILTNACPYFLELCAFPAYFPVKQSIVEANEDTWATAPATYIGNGPMKLTSWTRDSEMVYEKNEYFHDKDDVKATKLTFGLTGDDTVMINNYKQGNWVFIDSVPNDEINALKAGTAQTTAAEFYVEGQLGTYYLSFNINSSAFGAKADTEEKRVKVRQAISLMLDRNHIVTEIGKAGQTPANAFVATGLSDPLGGEFVDHNGVNGDGQGYYSVKSSDLTSNRAKAVELLKEVGYTYDESTKKFTDIPSFTYIYNTGTGHQAIGEYVQATLALYGLDMKLENQEWADFLNTRKAGDYTLARNGWLGDYNDPISFLDMWTTASGNNDCQFGR